MARIAVGGLLVDGTRVLLAKRSPSNAVYPGVWDVPRGRSEQGETPEPVLARELTEELGVIPIEHRELAILPASKKYPLPLHIYCVTKWEGTPRNLPENEHTEIRCVEADQLDGFDLVILGYAAMFRSIGSCVPITRPRSKLIYDPAMPFIEWG